MVAVGKETAKYAPDIEVPSLWQVETDGVERPGESVEVGRDLVDQRLRFVDEEGHGEADDEIKDPQDGEIDEQDGDAAIDVQPLQPIRDGRQERGEQDGQEDDQHDVDVTGEKQVHQRERPEQHDERGDAREREPWPPGLWRRLLVVRRHASVLSLDTPHGSHRGILGSATVAPAPRGSDVWRNLPQRDVPCARRPAPRRQTSDHKGQR